MDKKVLFSVVTVCRNAETVIEETIQSVLSQKNVCVEYIIIDGQSEDSTLQIIEKYKRDYPIVLLSEADAGLYDAMNKGARLAKGDYIHFLNAGDTYVSVNVLYEVEQKIRGLFPDFVYGHIKYCNPDGTKTIRKYGSLCGHQAYFWTGDCINHQAIFSKRSLFERNLFDIQYQICADREWMMRLKKNQRVKFTSIDVLICNYSLDADSISVKNHDVYQKETHRCIKKYYPVGYSIFCIFEFCRNNEYLKKWLHAIYKILYIRG